MIFSDLNLLRVLDVLLEERSVTRAGARLGLTQSAVSHALNRLRHTLGDELFVRGPGGMTPTARALEMGPHVHAALGQLQAALAPRDFDPATSDLRLTVVAAAYGRAVLAPALANQLAQAAPLVELVIGEDTPDSLERFDAHRIDFMITGAMTCPERLEQERLMTEELAWVVRAGSPLAERAHVDLEALVSTPHVLISRAVRGRTDAEPRSLINRVTWEDSGALDAALAVRGLRRQIGVTVPDTYTAIAVASMSDMAALIPRRLALLSAQGGRVKLIDPPYTSPPVELSLLYLKDRLSEPMMAWMRGVIREVAASC